jgi:hypothetical protein
MAQVSHLTPAWVTQERHAVQECWDAVMVRRVTGSERDTGVSWTLRWLLEGEVGPVTSRSPRECTWENARAESWVALCLAAGMPGPTEEDWRRLGATPLPSVTKVGREFAYGAWRTLSWLLGVREDWPVYTSWHRAASLPVESPHNYVRHHERDTDAWRAADRAAREQAQADALRHWQHVRNLADTNAGE